MSRSTQSPSWRRNLVAAVVASFIGFMGFTLVMPFLPLYFRQLGVTDVGEIALWSGVSLGVTPALTALLAPAWGRLADRFGLKVMVGRSLVSFVFVMTLIGCATTPWHVLALRAVQGLFAGYGALTLTMAAKSAPRAQLAGAIGAVQTAQRLGPAIGPVVGGVLAPLLGLRGAFFMSAGFYAAAFVLVIVLYREPPAVAPAAAKREFGRVTFRTVLAFENFLLLMIVIFGIQFVDRSLGPILPLFVAEVGTPEAQVPLVSGLLFSVAATTAAIGNQLCGRLLKRWPARLVIGACVAGGAGASAGVALAGGVTAVALAMPILGFGAGMATTAAYTAAGSVLPFGAQGLGFGFLTSASLVGLALSPVISGVLAGSSIRAVFWLDAATLLALTFIVSRVMVDAKISAGPGGEPVIGE